MLEIFNITFNQLAILFIFLAIGFILKKLKIVHDTLSNVLSSLEVIVFLPALCFNTFSQNVSVATINSKLPYFLYGVAILAVTFVMSIGLTKLLAKDNNTRDVYLYALTIPNIGYLGYPLINALYGEEMLSNTMLFCLPMNLFIYTAGIYILCPKDNYKFSLKKLLNPTMVMTFLGIIVGLTGLKMPQIVTSVSASASACMAPIAMIMTGFVLAKIPFKAMINNYKTYIVSALRLLIIPGLILAGMLLIKADPKITLIAAGIYAMPLGLNVVVFPEAYGGDSKTGAQSCLVSYVLCILTIPLVFSVISYFV
ncbi:MAG: AEC family transporter [Oscillospiraceae bacterium]|nr:AEC family transporter [Oscillospiraceae bacterium]